VNPRIGPFDVKVGLYRTGIIGMVSYFDSWFSFALISSLSHSVFDIIVVHAL
jgi:hypothetical protein